MQLQSLQIRTNRPIHTCPRVPSSSPIAPFPARAYPSYYALTMDGVRSTGAWGMEDRSMEDSVQRTEHTWRYGVGTVSQVVSNDDGQSNRTWGIHVSATCCTLQAYQV